MSSCIQILKKSDFPAQRLFFFPYAGAGAYAYRPWANLLDEHTDLIAIRLPGRESRCGQPFFTSMNQIVSELVCAVDPLLNLPAVFFGHSMGALIAFELARKLQKMEKQNIKLLVVSACFAPQNISLRDSLSLLDDESFLSRISLYGGIPAEILNDDELMKMIFPRLRADMSILDSYQYIETEKLNCPILSLYAEDDACVPTDFINQWKSQTNVEFMSKKFSGGHFYINENKDRILRTMLNYKTKYCGENK